MRFKLTLYFVRLLSVCVSMCIIVLKFEMEHLSHK